MKKIIISGKYFDLGDLKFVNPLNSVEFVLHPKLSEITQEGVSRLIEDCREADLAVFALFGAPIELLRNLPLERIPCPKVMWSYDSHHSWAKERAFVHHFDYLFIAHSSFLKYFPQNKVHWLPCCYVRYGIDELIRITRADPGISKANISLVFPHKPYDVGNRRFYDQAIRNVLSRSLANDFQMGPFESGKPFTAAIQSSRVVLNASLIDDLNIRNFEAWALNRVLLSNQSPDHSRIDFPKDSTIFYQRNLSDLKEKLALALEVAEESCWTTQFILSSHMLIHRLVEMINTSLGMNLAVDAPILDAPKTELKKKRKPALRKETEDIEIERASNVGVIVLSNRRIQNAPHLCAHRLQIEDNIGEAIHIHWRNFRFDFTVRDFSAIGKACEKALSMLRPGEVRINLTEPGAVGLDPAFLKEIENLKEHISGLALMEMTLDELVCITYTKHAGAINADFKKITETPHYRHLKGDSEPYLCYPHLSPTRRHSEDRFRELEKSMLRHGYPVEGKLITIFGNEPFIRDGQHRAAILRHYLGNVRIPVIRVDFRSNFQGWRIMPKKKEEQHDISAEKSLNRNKKSLSPISSIQCKILFIRTDSIGDNILSSFMLGPISEKYGAKVDILCQDSILELYELCPHVGEVISFDRERAIKDSEYLKNLVLRLKNRGYDVCLNPVYSRDVLTDLFTFGPEPKKSIGFRGNAENISEELHADTNTFFSQLVENEGPWQPELEKNGTFLEALGIDAKNKAPEVWLGREDETFANQFFEQNQLTPENVIGLFAGARFGVRIYSGYGTALKQALKGKPATLVAFGSKNEFDLNQAQIDDSGLQGINTCGQLTLRQTAALIKRCRLVVGAETGTAHLACAVGSPNVVLLGGGHFGRFMPYSSKTSAVSLPLECFGCNWKCHFPVAHCVKDVSSKIFADAIRVSMEKDSDKPRLFIQSKESWNPTNGPGWKAIENQNIKHLTEIIEIKD